MSAPDLCGLLVRNHARFAGRAVLVAGEVTEAGVLSALADCARLTVTVDDYPTFGQLAGQIGLTPGGTCPEICQRGRLTLRFAPLETLPAAERFEIALLFMPKNKRAAAERLARLAVHLAPDGEIGLIGANRAGGKSAGRLLAPVGTPMIVDQARKGTFWTVTPRAPFPCPESPPTYVWRGGGREFTLAQDHAVFSPGRLDRGTALLLEALAAAPHPGEALDLCCGCGIVALALTAGGADAVTCTDSSARALALCARNTAVLGAQITIRPADMLAGAGRYALIAVNPPFHAGTAAVPAVTLNMIASLPDHLQPGGEIYLVGNNFLPYRRALAAALGEPRAVLSRNGFTVWHARR